MKVFYSILALSIFIITILSCEKEKLVLDNPDVGSFEEVVIIDSLFKDSMVLALYDSMGVRYMDFHLSNIKTTESYNLWTISGQFDVINLLGTSTTSQFSFRYNTPSSSTASPGFNAWFDDIGTTYYGNGQLNNAISGMVNHELHISGNYQLDSVTVNPYINPNCDSLYGAPEKMRFFPK